jgi:hypothetical protein
MQQTAPVLVKKMSDRQKRKLTDSPWIALAAAAGVLIVLACAILVYAGWFGTAADALPSPGTAAGVSPAAHGVPAPGTPSSGKPGALSYNVAMTTGYEIGDVAVPATGVFMKVIYRGSYAGTWSSGNATGEVRNSGERVLAIDNPGSAISASLLKLDASSRQPLTVEIWKDGTRRAANSTSVPYGEVLISAAL